jgi:uncharacterized membrane protein YfbV (UPF0208 family)
MPPSAYGLVALFSVISAASGWLATRTVGPPRWWAAIVPTLAAFGALYVVGHRSALRIGPEVEIFGWQVSLAFDVAVAVATALLAGLLQRAGLRLLEAQQGGARGNGLA